MLSQRPHVSTQPGTGTLHRSFHALRDTQVFARRYREIPRNDPYLRIGYGGRSTMHSPRPHVCFAGPERTEDQAGLDSISVLLPVVGLLAFTMLGAPLLGMGLPTVGIIVAVLAISAVTGTLDRVSAAYGVSPLNSALGIAGIVIGILAIPAFLKLGVILMAGLFVVNLLLGAGMSAAGQSASVDPADAIIDVDYDTIDD